MVKPTRVTNSIRARRFAADEMTQAELADRVGVTRQTVIAIVREVTSEFFRTGFRRVAYLNGHYENSSLVYEALTEAIEPCQQTCKAILVNWWEQIRPEDIERIFGGNFPGYRRSANELFVENLARFLAGRELINVVDKRLGY